MTPAKLLPLAVIAALAILVFAPGARADAMRNLSFAGGDGLLLAAVAQADGFWASQGAPAKCAASLWLYDDPDPDTFVGLRGDLGGCRVYINRQWLADDVRSRLVADYDVMDPALEQLCQLVTHERGHNLGYEHTNNGSVMDPDGGLAVTTWRDGHVTGGVIPRCRTWASQVTRGLLADVAARRLARAQRRCRHHPRRKRCVRRSTLAQLDRALARW